MSLTPHAPIANINLLGRAPGIYRRGVFPAPEPRLLTGVPCFLGYARQGPVNEPVMLMLWSQFAERFGAPLPNGYLAAAVRGFFENDGLLCYVLRLDDQGQPLSALRAGLETLSALESIDLVCTPDTVGPLAAQSPTLDPDTIPALQSEVLGHCQRLGDRFAILDAVLTAETTAVTQQRAKLRGDYGALYHPWLLVEMGDGERGYVPPCGHVAGVYSRCDQQVGAHKAPANALVAGTLDVRSNITGSEQSLLNDHGVNGIRSFPGRGIRVWGARTLSRDPAWTYVNVRRLFMTVARWLERFMTELIFSTNDVSLWVRIMREVTAYLEDLFHQGALKGRTPEEAFFVKCDGETNPQDVRDAGMVVTDIGLAAAVPGEFIVMRIVHGDGGVSLVPHE